MILKYYYHYQPVRIPTLHLEKAVGQDTDNDIWRDHLHVQAKCHQICFMHHTINNIAGCHYLQFSI